MRSYLKKYPSQKKTDRVTQGVGPEFKPQYCKKILKNKHIKASFGQHEAMVWQI
jgi:hypothetical protein